ncbi:glycosyltransferase [bacterium]|nr:glycosyltransferase [bacterium]
MNILFLHRNFPAQFRYIIEELTKDKRNEVIFVTNNTETRTYAGVKKLVYNLKRKVPDNCHRYTRFFEESIIHGQSAAEVLIALENSGFKPDVIIGHSWGSPLFVKEIFPDVPYIAYVEWYYNYVNSDVDFGREELDVDEKALLTCRNAHILLDLVKADCILCPTQWQKAQIPPEFHNKVTVLHDGINTNYCKPDENVKFKVPDKKNLVLTTQDEVLTYATRGMEEYRGFPQFMEAVSILQKQRPNLHVIVGGEDRVCYGKHLPNNDTFKKKMLREHEYDMSRLHFTGLQTYNNYVNLLQVSTAHVYLTYPFVLSWSFLEAMAIGCRIIASDTPPVTEIMKDNYNGILTDFFDVDALVEKINDVLDNREKYNFIRENARETILKSYKQSDLIPKQLELIYKVAASKAKS